MSELATCHTLYSLQIEGSTTAEDWFYDPRGLQAGVNFNPKST